MPEIWSDLEKNTLVVPENSRVPKKQQRLMKATLAALNAIAVDIRGGLLETVGIESAFSIADGRCSMMLKLPEKTDAEKIAKAIDLENVEAWNDADGKVHIAVSPWFSTKDVDQTVLSAVKVIHVLLGMHAGNENQARTLKEKILFSVSEIIQLQKNVKK